MLYCLAGGLHILKNLNHRTLLRNRVQRAREHIPAVFAVFSSLMSCRQKDTSLCTVLVAAKKFNFRLQGFIIFRPLNILKCF